MTLEANESPSVSWVYGLIRAIKVKVGEQERTYDEIARMCNLYSKELDARLAYM